MLARAFARQRYPVATQPFFRWMSVGRGRSTVTELAELGAAF